MSDKLCASCYDFSIDKYVKSMDNLKPYWLSEENYVENFILKNTNFSTRFPKKYDTVLKLYIGKQYKGHLILYWASIPKTTLSPLILDAKKAYSKFENNGIVKIDKNGFATFKFLCPQPYKTQQKKNSKMKTFFRHLHFVISNKENNSWLKQIYTKIVVCKLNFKQSIPLISSGLFIILNALPCEYYAKDHIPNSYNLNEAMIKKMSHNELVNWLHDVVKLHYPKLYNYIKNRKMEIYELPILMYCAHDKCDASEKAVHEIMKKGFVNVQDYTGGIMDYRKYRPHD